MQRSPSGPQMDAPPPQTGCDAWHAGDLRRCWGGGGLLLPLPPPSTTLNSPELTRSLVFPTQRTLTSRHALRSSSVGSMVTVLQPEPGEAREAGGRRGMPAPTSAQVGRSQGNLRVCKHPWGGWRGCCGSHGGGDGRRAASPRAGIWELLPGGGPSPDWLVMPCSSGSPVGSGLGQTLLAQDSPGPTVAIGRYRLDSAGGRRAPPGQRATRLILHHKGGVGDAQPREGGQRLGPEELPWGSRVTAATASVREGGRGTEGGRGRSGRETRPLSHPEDDSRIKGACP